MENLNKLTEREKEVAELLSWGATKKEAAEQLFLSPFTVDNHLRKIFDKTGCKKVNELSAWWFCNKFKISMDLNPLKRAIISCVLLLIITPSTITYGRIDNVRNRRKGKTRITLTYSRRTERWQEIQL